MTKRRTRDTWWFNVSHPKTLTSQDVLQFNLWDTSNNKLLKQVTIDLSDIKWISRLRHGSTHNYQGREILKVYAYRDYRIKRFILYFGHVDDGLFPI